MDEEFFLVIGAAASIGQPLELVKCDAYLGLQKTDNKVTRPKSDGSMLHPLKYDVRER
jgi:hypothetical protein